MFRNELPFLMYIRVYKNLRKSHSPSPSSEIQKFFRLIKDPLILSTKPSRMKLRVIL